MRSLRSGAFNLGSSYVGTVYTERLREAAEVLKRYPDLHVRVEGRTDRSGAEERNKVLSQRRADRVKQILREAGLPEDRITTAGLGSGPTVDRGPASGDPANDRRVDIVVEEKTH